METKGQLRTNLKTAIAGIAIFGLVVLIYSQGASMLEREGGGTWLTRGRTMVNYATDIALLAADRELVIVVGSSMVEAGFDPLVFDQSLGAEGISATSYNYGLGNMSPRYQEIMARRISETFNRNSGRLSLALIEFNPFLATTRRSEYSRVLDVQNTAIFSSHAEILSALLSNPAVGTRMMVIRYLRHGYSAEMLTTMAQLLLSNASNLARVASEEYRLAQLRRSEAGVDFGNRIAEDKLPRSSLPGWNPATRGGRIDTSRLSSGTLAALDRFYETMRYPLFLQEDLQNRIDTADILELRFDESQISAFIEMAKHFEAISDKVEVILLPRYAEYIAYTPEVQARLESAKQRIQDETGVVVKDFQLHPMIESIHFADATHLTPFGAAVFSRSLASEYANQLRAAD